MTLVLRGRLKDHPYNYVALPGEDNTKVFNSGYLVIAFFNNRQPPIAVLHSETRGASPVNVEKVFLKYSRLKNFYSLETWSVKSVQADFNSGKMELLP